MKYKAIVFDLDGTAIPNSADGMPSPRLIRAIDQAKNNLRLFVATSRPISLALPVIQALNVSNLCVIAGGTIVFDPVSGKTVHEALLNRQQLEAIRQVCLPYPYPVGVDSLAAEQSGRAAGRDLGDKANIVFIPQIKAPDLTALVQRLSKIPGTFTVSLRGWTDHVIHVTAKDGSKERGIKYVLKQLGVTRDETIGVGDGDNDIHLFAAVGHRIAMGNASEQLKGIADEIAPSIDEDGLAWVIEKYGQA